MAPKEYNPEEAFDSLMKHEEEMKQAVYIEEGFIVINVAYEYNIELARCDSLEKNLGVGHAFNREGPG